MMTRALYLESKSPLSRQKQQQFHPPDPLQPSSILYMEPDTHRLRRHLSTRHLTHPHILQISSTEYITRPFLVFIILIVFIFSIA